MALAPAVKRNIAILATAQVLFMVATSTVMTLSSVVGGELTHQPGLATLPVTAMMVGTVVSTLPASLFMKRVGRRAGFITGTGVGGVLGGAVSFFGIAAGSFWLFCAGSFFIGLYQGFAMYYRFAAAEAAGADFRSRAISLIMAGGVAAAFLGPWNASAAIGLVSAVPFGGPYLNIGLLALLAMGLLTGLKLPDLPAREEGPGAEVSSRPMRVIASKQSFIVALTAGAIGYAVMVLVMTATPLAMQGAGFNMDQVAFIMQWHILGMFAPSFITGGLIDRFGLRRILLAGVALLVASAVVALAGLSLTHFWISLVLLGVGWNFLFIGGSTLLAASHTDAERGKVQGVNDLVIFSLVALGSLLAGALLHWLGWKTLNMVMLAPTLIVAVAVLRLRAEGRQKSSA